MGLYKCVNNVLVLITIAEPLCLYLKLILGYN